MEFVRGTKIDALPAGTTATAAKLAEVVRMTMFKMCFEDGFVHADLHPGNMVVQDDGTLVIFDAGLAKLLARGRADPVHRHDEVHRDGHARRHRRAPQALPHVPRRDRLGGAARRGRRVRARSSARKDIAKLEYGELIGEMFAIGRKHHVHPVTDMMLVFVALITAQGIGKMLEPEHNMFGAVAQFLIPILMKRNEHVPDTAEARAARATG